METRCRHCGKMTKIIGRISEAQCEHCGNQILGHDKLMCHVHCKKCGTINTRPAYGWQETNCSSCNARIKHPSKRSKGGRKDRGKQNGGQVSFVLPDEDKKLLQDLAKEYKTTLGGIARFVTKVGLDRPN